MEAIRHGQKFKKRWRRAADCQVKYGKAEEYPWCFNKSEVIDDLREISFRGGMLAEGTLTLYLEGKVEKLST